MPAVQKLFVIFDVWYPADVTSRIPIETSARATGFVPRLGIALASSLRQVSLFETSQQLHHPSVTQPPGYWRLFLPLPGDAASLMSTLWRGESFQLGADQCRHSFG